MTRTVGIVVFDGVEVLDFAGPFEVFSRTRLVSGIESRRSDESAPLRVILLGVEPGPITATGGLKIEADYTLAAAPPIDILVIPGGFGTRPLLDNRPVVDEIRRRADGAELVASVCTGALLLAKAGLLDGRRATTHWGALDLLGSLAPVDVVRDVRYVDDGVVTSAGVSAGIDMSLAIVERLFGKSAADDTARYMDYRR